MYAAADAAARKSCVFLSPRENAHTHNTRQNGLARSSGLRENVLIKFNIGKNRWRRGENLIFSCSRGKNRWRKNISGNKYRTRIDKQIVTENYTVQTYYEKINDRLKIRRVFFFQMFYLNPMLSIMIKSHNIFQNMNPVFFNVQKKKKYYTICFKIKARKIYHNFNLYIECFRGVYGGGDEAIVFPQNSIFIFISILHNSQLRMFNRLRKFVLYF